MLNKNLPGILFVFFVFLLPACKKQKDVPVSECGTVWYDGFEYHTVQIGNQCWLRENLRSAHYNDGTPLTEAQDSTTWVNDLTGAWCNYGGGTKDVTNQQLLDTDAIYGKLYTWKASRDPRLCPDGWHVPTMEEWKELTGNYIESGNALKKVDTLWTYGGPYAEPSNISNFSALPGGARFENATYHRIHSDAYFWSYDPVHVLPLHIHYNTKFADTTSTGIAPARDGFSCRCVKNN